MTSELEGKRASQCASAALNEAVSTCTRNARVKSPGEGEGEYNNKNMQTKQVDVNHRCKKITHKRELGVKLPGKGGWGENQQKQEAGQTS